MGAACWPRHRAQLAASPLAGHLHLASSRIRGARVLGQSPRNGQNSGPQPPPHSSEKQVEARTNLQRLTKAAKLRHIGRKNCALRAPDHFRPYVGTAARAARSSKGLDGTMTSPLRVFSIGLASVTSVRKTRKAPLWPRPASNHLHAVGIHHQRQALPERRCLAQLSLLKWPWCVNKIASGFRHYPAFHPSVNIELCSCLCLCEVFTAGSNKCLAHTPQAPNASHSSHMLPLHPPPSQRGQGRLPSGKSSGD